MATQRRTQVKTRGYSMTTKRKEEEVVEEEEMEEDGEDTAVELDGVVC